MLCISTPYGDHYKIDKDSNFIQYNQCHFDNENVLAHEWKLLGLLPTNCSNFIHLIRFNQITPEWIKSHSLSWKNGHPKYTIVDLDHGSTRVWGNTHYHGVRSLWFEA